MQIKILREKEAAIGEVIDLNIMIKVRKDKRSNLACALFMFCCNFVHLTM